MASRHPIPPYSLDAQVGFLLRVLYQRNTLLLAEAIEGLTPTQWAALARLAEVKQCSQNHLGRLIAADAATIKGVVDRLTARGLIEVAPDPLHRRRVTLSLSAAGRALVARHVQPALAVSDATLQRLTKREAEVFNRLLAKAANWSADALATPDAASRD